MKMSSPIAVRSFKSETAASEALSRLESMGISCFLIAKHFNLAGNTWLFVSPEQDDLARETLRKLPSDILQASVQLVPISEADIIVYASKFGDRHSYQWALWLIMILFPVIFYHGIGWALVTLSIFAAVVLVFRRYLGCPCCGRIPMDAVRLKDFLQCPSCGIRCVRQTA
jgi:hypothetical protein